MFVFFHVAIPLLMTELFQNKGKWQFSRIALIIGSMLPDIVDKPFALMGLSSGRDIFHAPFLWIIVWGFLILIPKTRTEVNSLILGTFFHLIIDLPSIPLFWPFVQYDWTFSENHLAYWIWALTHNPLVIVTELLGLIIIAYIIWKYKLILDWHRIREFLFVRTLSIPKF